MDQLAFVCFYGDRDQNVDNDYLGNRAADSIFFGRQDGRRAAANLLSAQRRETETRPVGSVLVNVHLHTRYRRVSAYVCNRKR